MSDNAFQIAPIFCIPIDNEENFDKNEEDDIEIISEEEEEKCISEKNKEADTKDKIIIFSLNKADKEIKSMTNSSKIYISEIFKKNWKHKSRRLIAKLKKRLIKLLNQNNSNNAKNKIINKSNKNGNIEFDFINYYINNNCSKNNNKLYNISYNKSLINKTYNNKTFINNNFNNVNKFVNYSNIYNNITINNNQCNNFNISNKIDIGINNNNPFIGLLNLYKGI